MCWCLLISCAYLGKPFVQGLGTHIYPVRLSMLHCMCSLNLDKRNLLQLCVPLQQDFLPIRVINGIFQSVNLKWSPQNIIASGTGKRLMLMSWRLLELDWQTPETLSHWELLGGIWNWSGIWLCLNFFQASWLFQLSSKLCFSIYSAAMGTDWAGVVTIGIICLMILMSLQCLVWPKTDPYFV